MTTTQDSHQDHHVAEHKAFAAPDETRTFPHGKVGRLTLEPGWRWSVDVRPIAGTDLCEAPHFQYQVTGRLQVVMADGTVIESRAGDVTALPQGHDAWVLGDEAVVLVDWWGASNYAKS